MFFWGWRDCNEEGDDRISGTYADRHDDISRNGSSEFGGNAGSAETLEHVPVIARSAWLACPVQRDAGDSAERARLRSSPDCQAEDALFAARSLQAQHLVLSAPLFAVVATT
jgi:hypothetical protein